MRILAALVCFGCAASAMAADGDFAGQSLKFSKHPGENLSGVNFSGADLSHADFSGADLRETNLTGANIDRAKFDKADLRGVRGWQQTKLGLGLSANDADFSGTDLHEAKIVGGYSGGYFERANFKNADLTNAILHGRFHGAKFDGATVKGTLMIGADGLEEIHDDLRKRGALITADDVAAASKAGRDFVGVTLHGAQLVAVSFSGGVLRGADLHSANLDRTQFADADLEGAELYFGSAEDACFDRAKLVRAHFDGRQAQGASFQHANLRNATFMGTNLQRADFRNADLSGADLSRADLSGADFTGAKLDGIVVEAAILKDIRGLDPGLERQLLRQAARWKYDLANAFEWFVSHCSFGLHLLLTPLALLAAIAGYRTSRARRSFAVLIAINSLAFAPFCAAFLFGLLGGSPTAQMSSASLWSAWFRLWPIMMLGLLALLCASLAASGFHAIRYGIMKPREAPVLSVAAALLTPANCFFALGSLVLMAPDA